MNFNQQKRTLESIADLRLKTRLDQFSVGQKLGTGQFGTVFKVRHEKTKTVLAMKVASKKHLGQHNMEDRLAAEIEIQHKLKHPNVLRLKGFFEDVDKVFIILQFAENGELYRYMKKKIRLSERESAKIIHQLSDALIFCHSHNVIHRDVKPENVLLDAKFNVLLCDFGWSVCSRRGETRSTICGTPDYLAPEMLEKRPNYDYKVDVWAVGVLCYELIAGKTPFEDQKTQMTNRTLQRIQQCTFNIPYHFSLRVSDLIRHLVVADPSKRMELKDVLKHPWLVHFKENTFQVAPPPPPSKREASVPFFFAKLGNSVKPNLVVNMKIGSTEEEKNTLELDKTQVEEEEEEKRTGGLEGDENIMASDEEALDEVPMEVC